MVLESTVAVKPNYSIPSRVARSLDKKEQVNMLILDFSKAFYTVPHQRLLNKMEHYGIKGNIHRLVSSWLTQHRRVCVDVEESSNKPVRSGVPQITVVALLAKLRYQNVVTT